MKLSQQIANHFKGVYFGGNWTSSNLHDQLKDLDWEMATAQVFEINTIATLAYHIHYFVLAQTEVLEGRPLNAKDALSFDHPPIKSQEDWDNWLASIWPQAEHFITLLENFPEEKLEDIFTHEKYGIYYGNIQGLIEHTHYHLGQIALLKKVLFKR